VTLTAGELRILETTVTVPAKTPAGQQETRTLTATFQGDPPATAHTTTIKMAVEKFGACCFEPASCMDLAEPDCKTVRGLYRGDGTLCASEGICFGACCAADNQCTQTSEAQCKDLGKGYVFGGAGTICGADGTCIPALSEWGVAVMAMLVLTAGTIVVMRRRAAAAA